MENIHQENQAKPLAGKKAIVTGGNKGVGRGIVYALVKSGADVLIIYNSSQDFADETLIKANEIRPDSTYLYKADISKREEVRGAVAMAIDKLGGIDVLINNAALQPNMLLEDYDIEMFKRIWNINIGGYFMMTQECLPYLKQSHSPRIINTSSVHGVRPSLFDAGYSMTKSAIRMFTREAAIELAKYGITVNCITLGACRIEGKTGGFGFPIHWLPETRTVTSHPLGITEPGDVGELAVFLAGEGGRIISGTAIRQDGASTLL